MIKDKKVLHVTTLTRGGEMGLKTHQGVFSLHLKIYCLLWVQRKRDNKILWSTGQYRMRQNEEYRRKEWLPQRSFWRKFWESCIELYDSLTYPRWKTRTSRIEDDVGSSVTFLWLRMLAVCRLFCHDHSVNFSSLFCWKEFINLRKR